MGGIYIRDYASRYPQDVAGLIFVDAATPDEEDRMSGKLRAASEHSTYEYYLYLTLSTLGVERVMGECSDIQKGVDEHLERMRVEDACGKSIDPVGHEYQNSRQSDYEIIHTGPYGDLPVLIFSHDPQSFPHSGLPPKLETEMIALWEQGQEELKALSTRSRRIIAKGSGHHIPRDRADLIDREVPLFIEQIRNGSPPPVPYGSRATE